MEAEHVIDGRLKESLSSWRAWIEITTLMGNGASHVVALLMESVD